VFYNSGKHLANKTKERGKAECNFRETSLHPFSEVVVVDSSAWVSFQSGMLMSSDVVPLFKA
jgi:hypothetical protein